MGKPEEALYAYREFHDKAMEQQTTDNGKVVRCRHCGRAREMATGESYQNAFSLLEHDERNCPLYKLAVDMIEFTENA